MLVACNIGHAGRPSRWADRGAAFEGREETSIVRAYLDAADRELRRLGHRCVLLSDGEYSAQWKRADDYGADVYLAGHVNGGGGDRGEVFYDHRSARGKALAESIAKALDEVCPWPVVAKPCRPDDDGEPRDEDYSEAFNCIKGVRAVAVLIEAYFIDGPQRAWFLANLDAIGVAIARGIHTWTMAR
jgi:N-acetylmuramoyl-L-alanine amidase